MAVAAARQRWAHAAQRALVRGPAPARACSSKRKIRRGVFSSKDRIVPLKEMEALRAQWAEEERAFEAEHGPKAAQRSTPWNISAGVVLERLPVIEPELPDWAQAKVDLREEEAEALLEHMSPQAKELRAAMTEAPSEERFTLPDNIEDLYNATVQDFFNMTPDQMADKDVVTEREQELQRIKDAFKPLPRVTEDDESGNVRSLYRRLDEPVYLVVRKKRRNHAWQFPQREVKEGEPLDRAAKRAIGRKRLGKYLQQEMHGYAPAAHIKYPYPVKYQDKRDAYGAKVFFFRGIHLWGNVQLKLPRYVDHAWLTRSELQETLHPSLFDAVKPLLY